MTSGSTSTLSAASDLMGTAKDPKPKVAIAAAIQPTVIGSVIFGVRGLRFEAGEAACQDYLLTWLQMLININMQSEIRSDASFYLHRKEAQLQPVIGVVIIFGVRGKKCAKMAGTDAAPHYAGELATLGRAFGQPSPRVGRRRPYCFCVNALLVEANFILGYVN
jgi:hypothetical protein